MKAILSIFVVLIFVAGCGGDDSAPENSPDFEKIEIPSSFMDEGSGSVPIEQEDAHLVPDEMVELFKDALTKEYRRDELIRRTREASFCNALDGVSDQEIWDEMVDQFNFDSRLHTSGNSLEEAIRNLLAFDLDLELDEESEIALYGETLDEEDFFSILADEVDGLDTSPGQCS